MGGTRLNAVSSSHALFLSLYEFEVGGRQDEIAGGPLSRGPVFKFGVVRVTGFGDRGPRGAGSPNRVRQAVWRKTAMPAERD